MAEGAGVAVGAGVALGFGVGVGVGFAKLTETVATIATRQNKRIEK